MAVNPFDPTQEVGPLIDQLIGSAYPAIKEVSQSLPEIRHVSANLEAIYNLSIYSEYINDLLANIAVIQYVSENVDDLNSINSSIVELTALGGNIDLILAAAPEALASSLKAFEWADKAVDSQVETGKYSAKHHATKAAASEAIATTKAAEALASAEDAADSASLITSASWVMTLGLHVSGGNTYVKVTGYTGGIGTPPTAYIGWYLTAAGGYSADIGDAASIRGPAGAGSGDMLASANLSDLANKTTSFNTIKQAATTSYSGVVELATDEEAVAGTDTTHAVTPAGVLASIKANIVIPPVAVLSNETTAITTGAGKLTFRMPYNANLVDVRASLTTASSSGIVTVDINKNGTSILSTKLTIDASEKTSKTAIAPVVISNPTLLDDDEISFDIDTAGTNAKGLKVTLMWTVD